MRQGRSSSLLQAQSFQPKPELQVSFQNPTFALRYQIPQLQGVTAAWIEVWDRPDLLLRKSVPITASGTVEWRDTGVSTPDELHIALLDPDAPKGICIDSCTPEELNAVYPSSELLAGVGPDGTQPSPDLWTQAVRVVAGDPGRLVDLKGDYFTPESKVVIGEMTVKHRSRDLQFAPAEYVDMHHLKVWIPAELLTSPGVLPLVVLPPPDDPDEGEPALVPEYPNTRPDYSASVVVASQASPRLERLEPPELTADAADKNGFPTDSVDENNLSDEEREKRHSVVVRLLGTEFTKSSRVVLGPDPLQGNQVRSEFISPDELQIRMTSSRLRGSLDQPITIWVIDDKESCAISESRIFRVLPTEKIPAPTRSGWINTSDPYPVPLMAQQGPNGMELTIHGEDFRANDEVVAAARWYSDGQYKKLKTTFISSQELKAWLPQEMWRIHQLSFRFVIRTTSGERAIEVPEPQ